MKYGKMTEEELTEWEHKPNIIEVLISYEMGAWLSRRDDRLLDRIQAEIRDVACYVNGEMMIEVVNLQRVLEIIGKYKVGDED